MKLELTYNEDELEYDTERELNQQPLRIDFLVIKKNKDTIIKNELGRFFLGHNLMEYKSAEDQLNIDDLFKVIAYGCLYKAYAKEVDGISADDITLSLVRERKPIKLFSYFKIHGITLEVSGAGIYIVHGYSPFPIQFIILRELNTDAHIWLTSLTKDIEKEQLQQFFMAVQQLQKKNEKIYADAVVSVVTQANHRQLENMKKEDERMYGELLRILKPDLDEEIEAAVKETTQDITKNMILRMLEKGKYEYDEIADISGTSVETVKEIANSAKFIAK